MIKYTPEKLNEEMSNLFFCVVDPLLIFNSVEYSVQSQRVYMYKLN